MHKLFFILLFSCVSILACGETPQQAAEKICDCISMAMTKDRQGYAEDMEKCTKQDQEITKKWKKDTEQYEKMMEFKKECMVPLLEKAIQLDGA